jgi:hypothetical protein
MTVLTRGTRFRTAPASIDGGEGQAGRALRRTISHHRFRAQQLPSFRTAPFKGLIEYCELKSTIGQYYDCSDALAAMKAQCTSANSRLSLTPR